MRVDREKIFTTKDTKDTKVTKFGVEIVRTLRVLCAFVVIESDFMSEAIDANS